MINFSITCNDCNEKIPLSSFSAIALLGIVDFIKECVEEGWDYERIKKESIHLCELCELSLKEE